MSAPARKRLTLTLIVGVVVTGWLAGASSAWSADDNLINQAPAGTVTRSADQPLGEAGKAKDKPRQLSAHDERLLAEAVAKKQPKVTTLIATQKGNTEAVATQIRTLGGTITNQVDAVGYLKAVVPTNAVSKAATLPGLVALDLNELIPLEDPKPEASTEGVRLTAPTPPGPATPAVNAYLPTHETGSVTFKTEHPEWDGRGTTIGILDTGVDLDNPALQTTSTGERKIVDWVTATDPIVDGDGTWRPMLTTVTGPTFSYAGRDYTAPEGTYRVSQFSESITGASEFGGDVNRDGDTGDTFGVLYEPTSGDIRVDSDSDGDFTNNPVMRPYRENYDVGHFGIDNAATEVREQVPFVVEFRTAVDLSPAGQQGTADFVNIGIIAGAHGSHVAGIAAANDVFGNPHYDGQAPGAKLVSARACTWGGGCTAAALVDGMVDLVVNRRVDIVNMSIGGLPALNDANNARATLYNRLINDFGVQLFISAGNSGPGLNTVGDPSVASDVVSVAASISKDTWLANYGSVVKDPQDVVPFSSRGPREDGGFKPNITAPGAAVSTTQLWLAGSPVAEAGYPLPAGTAMFQGTSMASPQAAGAAALLLGAARANDLGVTPGQLRQALYSGAQYQSDIPAYAQGAGIVDVPKAWDLLEADIQTRAFGSSAPVCSPLSGYLATPNQGPGIYNRCASTSGGHKPGESKAYAVTVTRLSGPTGPVRHTLRWVGNDGTFRSPGAISLPLNQPRTVTVRAKPAAGAHAAILEVDDPNTVGVDYRTLNVVVASADLVAPGFGSIASGSNERNHTHSVFVTVPPGAATLQVNLGGIATGSHTRFIAINPYGLPADPTSTPLCYLNYANPTNTCKPDERSYDNPVPGVWEIEVEARRTTPSLNNPFQIRTVVQGVTLQPETVTLPSVTAGVPTPVTWNVTNAYGPVTITGQGGPLASQSAQRPTISHGERHSYTVVVPAGATRLDAAIKNPADPGADLDLYVYRDGVLVGLAADGDSDESVTLSNPQPGTYSVLIDGYSVPSGSTAYDYRDAYYSPTLGTLTGATRTISLANGQTAALAGTVTVSSQAGSGRQLYGELRLVTEQGAVVGRGSLLVGNVG